MVSQMILEQHWANKYDEAILEPYNVQLAIPCNLTYEIKLIIKFDYTYLPSYKSHHNEMLHIPRQQCCYVQNCVWIFVL